MSVESSSQDRSLLAEPLLRELGRADTSGVLEISHPSRDLSHVWVRQGGIYAMQVPGYRPALGVRLLSGGLVSPEQLSQAAAEQRERLHPPRIGEVLVAHGHVRAEVVEAFVAEQVLDQLADLLDLEVLGARFHPGRRIRQDVIPPTPVDELLAAAHAWRDRRLDALARVGGPRVVPHLRPPGNGSTQTPLGPDDWALLCRVDGRRDIHELARVCGFTLQQAAQIVADLALTAVLVLPEAAHPPEEDLAPVVALHRPAPPDPQWEFDGTAAGEPDPVEPAPVEPRPAEPDAVERDPGAPALGAAAHAHSGALEAHASELALEPAQPDTAEPPRPLIAEFGALLNDARPEPPGAASAGTASAESLDRPTLTVVPAAPDPATATDTATDTPRVHPATQPPPIVSGPASNGEDTSVFMRELSSLSDDPDRDEPIVTRLVVPLTEERRRRRRWGR